MMRTGASRALLRPFATPTSNRARFAHNIAQRSLFGQQNSVAGKKLQPLALTAFRGANTALVRNYASSVVPGSTQDIGKEKKLAEEPLASSPQFVSSDSSTHPVFSEHGTKQQEDDVDMMAGIKHDLVSASVGRENWTEANRFSLLYSRKSSRTPSLWMKFQGRLTMSVLPVLCHTSLHPLLQFSAHLRSTLPTTTAGKGCS